MSKEVCLRLQDEGLETPGGQERGKGDGGKGAEGRVGGRTGRRG